MPRQAPPDKIKQFNSISPNETCGQYEPSLSGNCTLRAMRKSIAGCMSSVDDAVGVVREALKDAGMADDTLVVLSTDNGGPTAGADSNNMNNFPLRGCKGGYFDGGMRAVGAITGPLAKKSYVSRALHHVSDWLPTLLTAAARGLPDEDGNVPFPHARFDASATRDGELPFLPGDGVDNWDAINAGAPSARAELLHVAQANGSVLDAHAIRVGDMKLLWHPAGTDCSTSHAGWCALRAFHGCAHSSLLHSLRRTCADPPPGLTWNYTSFTVKCPQPPDTPEHKLLQQCTQDAPCLFNITADPCEMNNLAAAMPDQVHRLKARMDTYLPHVVLPWNNYRGDTDPRSAPSNHGPQVPIANQGPTFPGAPTTSVSRTPHTVALPSATSCLLALTLWTCRQCAQVQRDMGAVAHGRRGEQLLPCALRGPRLPVRAVRVHLSTRGTRPTDALSPASSSTYTRPSVPPLGVACKQSCERKPVTVLRMDCRAWTTDGWSVGNDAWVLQQAMPRVCQPPRRAQRGRDAHIRATGG